jgi:hypothetical protein
MDQPTNVNDQQQVAEGTAPVGSLNALQNYFAEKLNELLSATLFI